MKGKQKRAFRPRRHGCLAVFVVLAGFFIVLTEVSTLWDKLQDIYYAPPTQRLLYDIERSSRSSASVPKESDMIAFGCWNSTYTMHSDGTRLTRISEGYHGPMVWSPDGEWLAMPGYVPYQWRGDEVLAVKFDGSLTRRITFNYGQERNINWTDDGQALLFIIDFREIYRASMDGAQLEKVGELAQFSSNSYEFQWSPANDVYAREDVPSRTATASTLLIEALGRAEPILQRTIRGLVSDISWSPGGKRIAFIAGDAFYVYNIETQTDEHVLKLDASTAAWSPDGRWLALTYRTDTSVRHRLLLLDTSSGHTRTIAEDIRYRITWSPDSEWIAFTRNKAVRGRQIYKMRRDGTEATLLLDSKCGIHDINWSPR